MIKTEQDVKLASSKGSEVCVGCPWATESAQLDQFGNSSTTYCGTTGRHRSKTLSIACFYNTSKYSMGKKPWFSGVHKWNQQVLECLFKEQPEKGRNMSTSILSLHLGTLAPKQYMFGTGGHNTENTHTENMKVPKCQYLPLPVGLNSREVNTLKYTFPVENKTKQNNREW